MSKPRASVLVNYQAENMKLIEENFDLASNPPEVLFIGPEIQLDLYTIDMPKVIVTPQTRTPNIKDWIKKHREVISLEGDREFLTQLTGTAEHTLGLIHTLHRRIPAAHADVLSGNWNRRAWPAPRMLSQMRLGILGMGRIGQMVWNRAEELFELRLFWEPSGDPKVFHKERLHGLLQASQVLTIHLGLGYDGLIGPKELAMMPKGALLVNTAQGSIVQLDALLDALESGHLGGAALDVLPDEPALPERLLAYAREHDNLILTPHIAGSTLDAWEMTERRVIEKAIEWFKEN